MKILARTLAIAAIPAMSAAQEPQEPAATRPVYTPPPVVTDTFDIEDVEPRREPTRCFRANPAPLCRKFLITEFGIETPVYSSRSLHAGRIKRDYSARLTWNVGFMASRGRHSHGAAFGITSNDFTESGIPIVAEYRYRYWMGQSAIDAGFGYRRDGLVHPVAGSLMANGMTAMAGYTPNRWIGVQARADWTRAQGHSNHAVMLGLQSTRASEFMARVIVLGTVQALLGAIGIEVETATMRER